MKRPIRRSWTVLEWTLLGASLGVALWVLRQPFLDIIQIGARHEEQSYIFLAPIIAAWLVWLRRSRLRYIHVNPSLFGPLVVLAGWTASWFGFREGVQIAWHGGAVLVLVGVILSMTGTEAIRQFAPAFVALLFVLPVPGTIRHEIAMPLQGLATGVTHSMLEIFGVAATREGNILVINGQDVAVGEACNGMRMVFALTLVVYAFVFSTPLKPATRAILIALSPLTALLCNVIRLVPTSLFYGFGSPEHAHMFHDAAGWVMLPIALALLFGVLRVFKWLDLPVQSFRLAQQGDYARS